MRKLTTLETLLSLKHMDMPEENLEMLSSRIHEELIKMRKARRIATANDEGWKIFNIDSDGYIAKLVLERVVDYNDWDTFREEHWIDCKPSMYDCTGQAFTSWMRHYVINGKTFIYHRVSYDV